MSNQYSTRPLFPTEPPTVGTEYLSSIPVNHTVSHHVACNSVENMRNKNKPNTVSRWTHSVNYSDIRYRGQLEQWIFLMCLSRHNVCAEKERVRWRERVRTSYRATRFNKVKYGTVSLWQQAFANRPPQRTTKYGVLFYCTADLTLCDKIHQYMKTWTENERMCVIVRFNYCWPYNEIRYFNIFFNAKVLAQ